MTPLLNSLTAAVLVSAASFSALPLLLWGHKNEKGPHLTYLVALAAGTMIGGAMSHLFPEVCAQMGPRPASLLVLAGFSFFFFMERGIRWHHCHQLECRTHPVGTMSLVGDSLHNFTDGVLIAAAFLVTRRTGMMLTVMVLLHEVPQEIGDIGVLLHAGWAPRKAFLWNGLTALTAVAGAVLGSLYLAAIQSGVPVVTALGVGGFLYLAASDLIPELHREENQVRAWGTFLVFLAGAATMTLLHGE